MNGLLVALATAGLLGVTHAVEPDHVAGISSLTSGFRSARLSALVGACFSLGHVALVVLWLVGGYLVVGRTAYPPVFETVGTVGVAVALALLGGWMIVGGTRSLLSAHDHDHEDGHGLSLPVDLWGENAHLHRPAWLGGHDHDGDRRTTLEYLATGLVGAAFTLSPPLSMILFASTLFPRFGGGAVAGAVVAYAVTITVTMSVLGATVGFVFDATGSNPRLYGAVRAAGGLAVTAVAVTTALPVVAALA